MSPNRRVALGLTALPLALGALLVGAGPASAHPLGNFSVNHASRLLVGPERVLVEHTVDLAEIPTFQARTAVDTDHDGTVSPAEATAYSAVLCQEIAGSLSLTAGGTVVPLQVTGSTGAVRPGQAGLPTTRVTCDLTGAHRLGSGTAIAFTDATSQGRRGWHEVTAVGDGATLRGSSVPAVSPSKDLTTYPQDLLSSPLDVRTAALSASPGGGVANARAVDDLRRALPRGVDGLTASFTDLVGRQHLGLGIGLLALLVSVGLGAIHALAPGHGKTVMAAYLVGQRGNRRSAVWLGTTVTLTHTLGVLALGLLLSLSVLASPERALPALEMASGALLALVGGSLLRAALRRRTARHGHDHPHDHDHDHPHDHPHDHDHDHDHPHAHAEPARTPAGTSGVGLLTRPAPTVAASAPDTAGAHRHGTGPGEHTHELPAGPIGWRSLAAMGVAGGLVPSPSAVVVLLGAAALGRPWFGVLLVIGYGAGMAITLTVAGLLLLRARTALDARLRAGGGRPGLLGRLAHLPASRLAVLLPALTASVIVAVGLGLVVRGAVLLGSIVGT